MEGRGREKSIAEERTEKKLVEKDARGREKGEGREERKANESKEKIIGKKRRMRGRGEENR